MDSRASLQGAEALWSGVLAPLVLGGPLRPVRPLGPMRAHAIAQTAAMLRTQDAAGLDTVRVRVARRLCRVDSIPAPDAAQWLMIGALNDLLQCTNPTIDGWIRQDSGTLLAKVQETLGVVPAAASLRDALSRHATFARLLQIHRTDTYVSWWSGSRQFRGMEPPARLLAWKGLRRVETRTEQVTTASLTWGTRLDEPQFHAVLQRFLALSPLTDLAWAGRELPSFAWSESNLALLTSPPGRTLAVRALRSGNADSALGALQRASVPASFREATQSVVQELTAFSRAS